MTLTPIYQAEASIYAAHVLKEAKEPRVAVLYQNDDSARISSRASASGWATRRVPSWRAK